MITGRCECGSVAFTITADLVAPSACHCSQCRRLSGHYWSGTSVKHPDLRFTADATLTWYRSSDHAERGFCNACGASLFYRPFNDDHTSVAMGSSICPPAPPYAVTSSPRTRVTTTKSTTTSQSLNAGRRAKQPC
ncbi:GFA family protein [Phycobium rhodophyticola]